MSLNRREIFGAAGAAAVLTGMPGEARAAQGYQQRVANVQQQRQALQQQNQQLATQSFKIRILNQHIWPLRFGIFGMRGANLRAGMQYRATVNGNGGTHVSPRDINGGERMAIVWDEFSEAIVDYLPIVVNRDLTFTIDATGLLSAV